jgi:hypothetical protein
VGLGEIVLPGCKGKRLIEARDGEGFLAAGDENGGELGVCAG